MNIVKYTLKEGQTLQGNFGQFWGSAQKFSIFCKDQCRLLPWYFAKVHCLEFSAPLHGSVRQCSGGPCKRVGTQSASIASSSESSREGGGSRSSPPELPLLGPYFFDNHTSANVRCNVFSNGSPDGNIWFQMLTKPTKHLDVGSYYTALESVAEE